MGDVDLEAGLGYPLRGDGALKRHAVGGGVPALVNVGTMLLWILVLIEPTVAVGYVLLVPLQFAIGVLWLGYFVRVVRHTHAGDPTPPALGNWSGLVRDGLRASILGLAYGVPGLVLTAVFYGLVFASVLGVGAIGRTEPGAGLAAGVVGIVALMVGFLAVLAYWLAVSYLFPASLVVLASEGSVAGALSPGRLRPLALSSSYAAPWSLAAGLVFLAYTAVGFLSIVLVGYLLAPLLPVVYFYVGVAGFHMFALAYASETDAAAAVSDEAGSRSMPAADRGPEDI